MSGRGKGRYLRVDAQRNQEHILATTRALLPEHGPDMPMEDLARAAGVGVGTLYRRFGGRQALVEAAAEAAYESVMASAATARESQDGWEAFAGFVLAALPDLAVVGCLSMWYPDTWDRFKDTETEQRRRKAVMEVVGELVGRAQAAGRMRGDIDAEDVATMLALVLRPLPGRTDTLAAARRYAGLMLDGFRAEAEVAG